MNTIHYCILRKDLELYWCDCGSTRDFHEHMGYEVVAYTDTVENAESLGAEKSPLLA